MSEANGSAFSERALGPAPRTFYQRMRSGAIWSAIGRIGSVGALFVANVVLKQNMSDADYAAHNLAFAAVVLLGIPASLGVPKILLRTIREGLVRGDRQSASEKIASGLAVAAIGAVVVALLQIFGSYWVGDAPKWRALNDYAVVTAAWMALAALCVTLSHALQGLDDFLTAALVGARSGGVVTNVGFLATIVVLAQLGTLSLHTALWTQAIVYGFALGVAWIAWRRRTLEYGLRPTPLSGWRPVDRRQFAWFLGESWPNLVLQLTTLGIIHMEMLVVGLCASESETAAYGAVLRLLELLAAAQLLATLVAGPFIAELYAQGELARLERVVRGAATLVAGPTLAFLALFLFAPVWTLNTIYGDASWQGETIRQGASALQIAAVGAAIASLAGPNGLTMIMAGRQRELLIASLVANVVYLASAPFLIRGYGIVGAALATSVIFGAYNIAVTAMVKSRIGVWTFASLSPQTLKAMIRIARR